MNVQQWLGEHKVKVVGYRPSKAHNANNVDESQTPEEWDEHEGFFEEADISINESLLSSPNMTAKETFSGINVSSLNVNSLIVNKTIKARKILMEELRNNQIICLQDVRIQDGDRQKMKQIHAWARENIRSHPRVFTTVTETGRAGGVMIILPEN